MVEDYYTGRDSFSEASIMTEKANIYKMAAIPDKAAVYYRKALAKEPENPGSMYNLACLLIDKGLDINEGLELIENALELRPDSYRCLDCKGWGLYKQGKYKEALLILQKSWDLKQEKAIYNREAFLHLEAAKKAVANQKNN
jgi:tetratricopeptide (TPR) repeat protein